jgi:GrpB-like predicted nucleotidyltransferase (UPF0157 family)
MAQDILLHAYDPQWPALFEREKAALAAAAKGLFRQIYHIGSTAIPGMAAKPVIDILIVLNRHEDGFASAPAMEGLGYEYRGTSGAEGRHYFSNGTPHTHHVHMLALGHPEIGRLLRFRDYLRNCPDEARAYENLKRRLASRFLTDRRSYAEAKSEFCTRIESLSMNPQNGP